jgi:hypothetical protein
MGSASDPESDAGARDMPRFVILQHASPHGLHWDFMLEMGTALASWALAQPPAASQQIPARALSEHRLAYLDYDGPISRGRGTVTRWDEGTYQIERQAEGLLVVLLSGKNLTGRATLHRTGADPDQWVFSLEK